MTTQRGSCSISVGMRERLWVSSLGTFLGRWTQRGRCVEEQILLLPVATACCATQIIAEGRTEREIGEVVGEFGLEPQPQPQVLLQS